MKPAKQPHARRNRTHFLSWPVVVWAIALTATLCAFLLRYSNWVTRQVHPDAKPYLSGKKPYILCFWHGRMIMQPFYNPYIHKRRVYGLISTHRDGVLISAYLRCFGARTVTGSKSQGATKAMLQMVELAAQGHILSLTPDGPRGPFQVAAPGAVFLAMKTGLPLLPITYSCSRHRRLKSWDKFMLPKPFGRMKFIIGQPIHVAAEATAEMLRTRTGDLQDALNRMTQQADRDCGVAP
jgi:lysophospholipid acyltransferase (LPLAT)-like uncharacterized protein